MKIKISIPEIFENKEVFANISLASIKRTRCIKHLMERMRLDADIINLTYIRINKSNYDLQILSSNPTAGPLYWKSGLWKHEQILNLNSCIPIYNREISFSRSTQSTYHDFLKTMNANQSLVMEYCFGDYKDAFVILMHANKKYDLAQIYASLHESILYFYSQLQGVNIYFNLESFNQQIKPAPLIIRNFDFHKQLSNVSYPLSKTNYQYLFTTMLGLTSSQVAHIFHRSMRTVENSINLMKQKLLCQSKNELQSYLRMHYNQAVQEWIAQNKKYLEHYNELFFV